MSKKDQEDKLLNSHYDGIQEYDNALPRWWVWLFYLTIIFAVGYTWYYHVGGPGKPLTETLASDMQELEEQRKAAVSTMEAGKVVIDLASAVKEPATIQKGTILFAERCAPCHGAQGQGVIGPNLTDTFWIHGGTLPEIKKVIDEGVLEKGMLAWKGILSEEDIIATVAYIHSIQGTNPPGAKSAEGIEYRK